MIEYVLMLAFVGGLCFLFKYGGKSKKNRKIFCWIIFIVMMLFAGLRGENVGTDTDSYLQIFESDVVNDSNYFQSLEVGFRWLVRGVRFITSNSIVYQSVLAMIPIAFALKYIEKWSEDVYTSVFCYLSLGCYFLLFNTSRQCLAITLLFMALDFAYKRKWIKSLLIVFLASLFHATAIVFVMCIGLLFWQNYRNDTKLDGYILTSKQKSIIKFFVTVLVICYVLLGEVINWLIIYFPRYQALYINEIERNKNSFSGGNIYLIFINLAIWFALVFSTPANNKAKQNFLIPISLGVFFSILQYKYVIMARFVWYFDIYNIFVIPSIIKNNIFTRGSKKIVEVIITLLCIILYVYYVSHNYQGIVPYVFSI